MEQYLIIGFLGINSWTDIRRRQISLWSVVAFMIAGVLYKCLYLRTTSVMLLGLLPGAALLLISKATREALGMGDALLVLTLGIYLGLENVLDVLLWALLLAAAWAGLLLVFGRRRRDYEFPFVPFLMVSYIGRWLLWAA